MSRILVKQINSTIASTGAVILFNGTKNLWSNQDTGGILLSAGTTLERPSSGLSNGTIRYNTDTNLLEGYINNAWENLSNKVDRSGDTMTGTLNMPAGSSLLPSITFGDSSSGLFSAGTGLTSILSGGTEVFRAESTGASVIGSFGIGTFTPDSTAALEINSTTQGVLFPRLSDTERNAISSPPAGLVVYDTTSNQLEYFNGTSWIQSQPSLQLYSENPSSQISPIASGDNSIALGSGANSRLYGQTSHSSGVFSSSGDSQSSQYILRNQTVGASNLELFLDGISQRLVLPDTSTWIFKIYLVARRSDAAGDYGAWEASGIINRENGANTTAIIGGVFQTLLSRTNNLISINIVADTINGSLKISVINTDASKTYNWVARVETTEVS